MNFNNICHKISKIGSMLKYFVLADSNPNSIQLVNVAIFLITMPFCLYRLALFMMSVSFNWL